MSQSKKYEAPKASLECLETADIIQLSGIGTLDLDSAEPDSTPSSYWGDGAAW